MSYIKTCEVETAMAESTLVRAKRSNILPLLPMGHETVLTYFSADNFDHKVKKQQGGKMVNTTHLMAFQEAIEETNVFLTQMTIIKFPAPNVEELNMSKTTFHILLSTNPRILLSLMT